MTTKGYRRLLAGASATCIALGLIILPTNAFASGKGNGAANGAANGLAKGLDKNAAPTVPTTTTTAPSTPTVTIAAASNTSPTTTSSDTVPQPTTNNEVPGGPGANNQTNNPYLSTRDGSPSLNGNGNGTATGKPCAGCVGRADNKNPKGQAPGGSDKNAGYECDRNHGIGRSNPAHTGCKTTTTSTPPTTACVPSASNNNCCTSDCACTPSASNDHCCTSHCGGTTTTTKPGTSATSATTATTATTAPVTPATNAAGHSTSAAAAKVSSPVKSGSLAFTGADLGAEFLAGGMALAAGALLLGTTRRRRPSVTSETDTETGDSDI